MSKKHQEFPVVQINKAELFKSKDIMKTYRQMAKDGGIDYDKPHKIGIKTWFTKDYIFLRNFIIEQPPA